VTSMRASLTPDLVLNIPESTLTAGFYHV